MSVIKVGDTVIGEKPEALASRIVVEEEPGGKVCITYVAPEGLAGASKTYDAGDISGMRADVESFC